MLPLPRVWRINIKTDPASRSLDPRSYCIEHGLVGMGWPVSISGSPTWGDYRHLAEQPGSYGLLPGAVRQFHDDVAVNDLCWTRKLSGEYYLGRISGPWRYDASAEAKDMDVVNVRDCQWACVGGVERVPGRVASGFRYGTLQHKPDSTVRVMSAYLFNKARPDLEAYVLDAMPKDLFDCIAWDDIEDLVALWMEKERGFSLLPSSCKRDTTAVEWVMLHRETGKRGTAQVKAGRASLDTTGLERSADHVIVFTEGEYLGPPHCNVERIDRSTLEQFMVAHPHLVPPRVQMWRNLLAEVGEY